MVSCPLSPRERVRVRGFCPRATGTLTPALSHWERELEAPLAMSRGGFMMR
jgi:hypothetical protein